MNVLVACEFSGVVRTAFEKKGANAMSCDLLPTDIPGNHYQGDVRDVLDNVWDLIVAFPPCTDTSWSNGKLIHEKRKDGRTQAALDFAQLLWDAGDKVVLEHPWRSELQYWRKADQKIQPWMFGDLYIKTTGLWLKGVEPLVPTVTEEPEGVKYWISVGAGKQGRRGGIGLVRNSADRARTFQGIADAMAEAWYE